MGLFPQLNCVTQLLDALMYFSQKHYEPLCNRKITSLQLVLQVSKEILSLKIIFLRQMPGRYKD